MQALDRVENRVQPWTGYYYVAYQEPPHEGCEGGVVLKNLLRGMKGGRVAQEEPYAGFIPDIAIYGKGATSPSCVIECVASSPPSQQKVMTLNTQGIPVYVVSATKNAWDILHQPVVEVTVAGSVVPCGKGLRDNVAHMEQEWGSRRNSFIGIRHFPTNAQEYLWGECEEWGEASWSMGDPETVGLKRNTHGEGLFPEPTMVMPVKGATRRLSREVFLDYLMWIRCQCLQIERETRDRAEPEAQQAREVMAQILPYVDDLLRMTRHP